MPIRRLVDRHARGSCLRGDGDRADLGQRAAVYRELPDLTELGLVLVVV